LDHAARFGRLGLRIDPPRSVRYVVSRLGRRDRRTDIAEISAPASGHGRELSTMTVGSLVREWV
jgi:hypothetical protein